MSRARHNMNSKAGIKPKGKEDDYAGSGKPNVVKEAEEKKFGGKVGKKVDMMKDKKSKHRLDKKPRKANGGKVGADKSPFSSAASPSQNTEARKP